MKYQNSVYRSLAQIMQFGINMLVPIFLCTFIGIYLDRWLGTQFIVVIMFFLGAAAGARNVYRFAKSIYDKPQGPQYSSYDNTPSSDRAKNDSNNNLTGESKKDK